MTKDLSLYLINEIVRSNTKSATVLGNRLVRVFRANGHDVDALAAQAHADHVSQLQAKVERARKRNSPHVAKHEKSLRAAQKKPPVWPTAPTPERRQHSATVMHKVEVLRDQPVAHRFEWPIANLQHVLTSDEFQAASVLRESYYKAHAKSRVASWDGVPPGMMSGGGLPVTDRQLHAAEVRDALWYSLPYALQAVAKNFILEEPMIGQTKPLSRVEFGRDFIKCKDRAKATGASDAAIKATCAALAQGLKDYAGFVKAEKKRQDRNNVVPFERRKIT